MALPGLRGTEHIGFTVPNLELAHHFFVEIIGCEYIYSLGPFRSDQDNWMRDHLAVHPRSVVEELRFYRCAHGPNFEVFQWDSADGQRDQPRNSDLGGHHLAFYVDDLDRAVAYLRGHGVRVLGGPTASRHSSAGQRWVYFLSPWGMQFELVSFPDGKSYEKDEGTLLWHPSRPEA